MDEYIDVLNQETGEKTGDVILKKTAHQNGTWHGSIHLLIINNDHTKTLLQKRCELKDLYPNTWDIAVGGHISAGEDEFFAVERELSEELGLDPKNYQIEYLTKVKETLNNNGVLSNEFVSIFVLYADIDINDITLQVEEVSEAKWCTKEELNNYVKNDIVLPHVKDYELLNDLLK